jgi:hypothetical protein
VQRSRKNFTTGKRLNRCLPLRSNRMPMKKIVYVAVLLLFGLSSALAADRSTELDKAYQELVAAQRALEELKDRREQDEEPEPGDRIGTAKGGSRLLPQYFERQRTSERDLASAELRFERALERWKELR